MTLKNFQNYYQVINIKNSKEHYILQKIIFCLLNFYYFLAWFLVQNFDFYNFHVIYLFIILSYYQIINYYQPRLQLLPRPQPKPQYHHFCYFLFLRILIYFFIINSHVDQWVNIDQWMTVANFINLYLSYLIFN